MGFEGLEDQAEEETFVQPDPMKFVPSDSNRW